MFRRKGRFPAVDANGRTFAVEIFVRVVPAPSSGDPHAVGEGMTALRLANGEQVARLEQSPVRGGDDRRSAHVGLARAL